MCEGRSAWASKIKTKFHMTDLLMKKQLISKKWYVRSFILTAQLDHMTEMEISQSHTTNDYLNCINWLYDFIVDFARNCSWNTILMCEESCLSVNYKIRNSTRRSVDRKKWYVWLFMLTALTDCKISLPIMQKTTPEILSLCAKGDAWASKIKYESPHDGFVDDEVADFKKWYERSFILTA